jgi:hypothetical protein
MMTGLNFSMSYPVQITFGTVLFFPASLLVTTRLPHLASRNAAQFLAALLITTTAWLGALILLTHGTPVDTEDLCVGFFLYSGILLVYLEIWGLLSRGYTLGLLLTFYKTAKPLNAKEVADLYRGGEGLDWLIKHRFAGLISAKMIRREDDQVVLTHRGRMIASLYKLSLWFFGLRHSG